MTIERSQAWSRTTYPHGAISGATSPVSKLHASPGNGAVCVLPDDGTGALGNMLAGSVDSA
ncbi:MAG: hypothetical protein KKD78_10410 [Proteobacteria bacterium]|nr:hypothetical protein [Pseudomonadota bacterium]